MTDPDNPENIFEIDRIREFIELMEQHQLTELNLKQNKPLEAAVAISNIDSVNPFVL